MEHNNSCDWKIALTFVALVLVGCSSNVQVGLTEAPSLIPIATTAPTSTSTPAPTPLTYVGKVAFMHESNIYVINADGSGLKNLTNNPFYNADPAWSPDGKQIAYSSELHGVSRIYVMKADGSDQIALTEDKAGAWGPAWSPDGKYIVFNTDRDGVVAKSPNQVPVSEIYIMNSDGSEQRRLTNNQDFERDLSWSPNGDVIAVSANVYNTDGYGSTDIYLMGLDGRISKNPIVFGDIDKPVWSPDGQYIAFASTVRGKSEICTVKADGSNKVCLIQSVAPVYYLFPSWSPDGNYIVFSSSIDGYYNLYIMKSDGTNITRLTDMPGDEMAPAWAPIP